MTTANNFRHHPDGYIFLDDLMLSLSFFEQQEPGYELPFNATGRDYRPGVRHLLHNRDSSWPGELPWPEGDLYLSRVDQYKSAWEAAIAEANKPPPVQSGTPDYIKLEKLLRGTALFGRAFQTGDSNAWSLLLRTISNETANPEDRLNDFYYSLVLTRQGMNPDLSSDELNQLNNILQDCNFVFQLSTDRAIDFNSLQSTEQTT